jgi:hypothetical protein
LFFFWWDPAARYRNQVTIFTYSVSQVNDIVSVDIGIGGNERLGSDVLTAENRRGRKRFRLHTIMSASLTIWCGTTEFIPLAPLC